LAVEIPLHESEVRDAADVGTLIDRSRGAAALSRQQAAAQRLGAREPRKPPAADDTHTTINLISALMVVHAFHFNRFATH
jgi:hypothetical protein